MRILKELGEKNDMTNFAILQKPESETEYERQKKSLSDHWAFPIWYPANDKSHESVCIIFRELIADMTEENEDVTDINSTFSRNSVLEFIENQMKAKGITLTTHKEENITLDDLAAVCMGRTSGYSYLGLYGRIIWVDGADL